MPRRSPERDTPLVPVPAALGGLRLAAGASDFTVLPFNVRGGEVRPGSRRWFSFSNLLPFANGAFGYQSPAGVYYIVAVGLDSTSTWIRVVVHLGANEVASHTFNAFDDPPGVASDQPVYFSAVDNFVCIAGHQIGRLLLVEFKESGDIDIRLARSIDRSVDGNEYGAADDAGPFHGRAPDCVGVTAHQGRCVAWSKEGIVFWSDIDDPEAWSVNAFVRTANGGTGFDKLSACASINDANLLIGQRDSFYLVPGSLTPESGGGVARQVSFGLGVVAGATLVVVGPGVAMFLSERGPATFMLGQYIPLGARDGDLGEPGGVYPLFRPEVSPDLNVERLRPPPSAWPLAVARFSQQDRAYEIAIGAFLDEDSDIESRRMRLRFDTRKKAWSVEQRPPCKAILTVDDGDDDEVLLRVQADGSVQVEDLGDLDEYVDGGIDAEAGIDSELTLMWPVAMPFRDRLRTLHLMLSDNWRGYLRATVNHDGVSSENEDAVTLDVGDEVQSLQDFRFGVDALQSELVRHHRVGLPPLAAGRRPRLTLTGVAGRRWGLQALQVQYQPGDRY